MENVVKNSTCVTCTLCKRIVGQMSVNIEVFSPDVRVSVHIFKLKTLNFAAEEPLLKLA